MRLFLITSFLMLAVAGCGLASDPVTDSGERSSQDSPEQSAPKLGDSSVSDDVLQDGGDDEYVSACVIDKEHIAHVSQLLEENGIQGHMIGSRGFGVMVLPQDLERTKEIIQSDSDENGEYAYFYSGGLLNVCMIDPSWSDHVGSLLAEYGISAIIEGSIAYGVSVSPPDAARAEELIREDSEDNGGYASFYTR